jgi:hypothetical protein
MLINISRECVVKWRDNAGKCTEVCEHWEAVSISLKFVTASI